MLNFSEGLKNNFLPSSVCTLWPPLTDSRAWNGGLCIWSLWYSICSLGRLGSCSLLQVPVQGESILGFHLSHKLKLCFSSIWLCSQHNIIVLCWLQSWMANGTWSTFRVCYLGQIHHGCPTCQSNQDSPSMLRSHCLGALDLTTGRWEGTSGQVNCRKCMGPWSLVLQKVISLAFVFGFMIE